MLRGYKNFNIAGSASGLGLLLLAFLLVNPLVGSSVSALEVSGDEADSVETGEPATQSDDGVATQADLTVSSVNVAFSPTTGAASLTPTNSAGQSAQMNVMATVDIQNSGGYSIYVKGSSQNLVGQKDSNNIIPGVSGSSTYASLPVNTWGYYAAEGDAVPENATYKSMTTSGNGDKITENTSDRIASDSKTIALSFVAKINDQKPADIYQNTVTVSVVSSPMATTFLYNFGITTMQTMTSSICSKAPTWGTAQLTDARDGKKYWVQKMPDGKCWMTQNLALDLGTSWPVASLSDYTSASTAYQPTATASIVNSETESGDEDATTSWNFGEYVIIKPYGGSSSCATSITGLDKCPLVFTNVAGKIASSDPGFYTKNGGMTIVDNEYDAHYLAGNYYSWNTATAGTGGLMKSGNATGSICPKNWQLPTSNNSNPGSLGGLISAGGITSNTIPKLTGDGFFFVMAGKVWQSSSAEMLGPGRSGSYWSSTAGSSTSTAYHMLFTSASYLSTSSTDRNRKDAHSVRCVAR